MTTKKKTKKQNDILKLSKINRRYNSWSITFDLQLFPLDFVPLKIGALSFLPHNRLLICLIQKFIVHL